MMTQRDDEDSDEATPMNRNPLHLGWIHGLPLLLTLSLCLLALLDRSTFYLLMQEDGWAEWATFVAFMIGAFVGGRLAFRMPSNDILARLFTVGLAAFCLFVAGEEISWGQRLFAFEPPEVFLKHNYQQEANLHNLLKTIVNTRWIVLTIALVYGVILPVARLKFTFLRAFAPNVELIPWFSVVVLLELFYPFKFTGEFAELVLGLAFVLDLSERSETLPPVRAGLCAAALVLAVPLAPLFALVLYGNDPGNVATAEVELEMLSRDLLQPNVLKRKLFKKRSVHKRLFSAKKSEYFALKEHSVFLEGRLDRRDRKGYYLDPWAQPYWLRYQRSKKRPAQRLLLYSFGPNRRRDTVLNDVIDGLEVGGDDIFVTVALPNQYLDR